MATVIQLATGSVMEGVEGALLAYYQGEANTVGGYSIDGVEFPEKVDVGESDFDPSEHTVPEVEQHLAESTPAEQERVIDAEKSASKPRKTLVED